MAVARQIRVHAEEDGLVAVQTDTIVDPERGLIAEVEKVVVAVDAGEGKVAMLEQNRVKAIRAIPIQVQPQPDTRPASNPQPYPTPRKTPVTRSPRRPAINLPQLPKQHHAPTVTARAPLIQTSQTLDNDVEMCSKFLVCSCVIGGCVFLIAGALLVGLAATLVLPCEIASIPIIVFGCLTIIVGCVCFVSTVRIENRMAICCCIFVGILLGLMLLIAGYFGSVVIYTYSEYNTLRNETDIGGCEFDKARDIDAPFALTVLSYVLFGLACILLVRHMYQCCKTLLPMCKDQCY